MIEKSQATTTVVANINKIDVVVIDNGVKLVPIKPICEALGIAHQSQFERIKTDPILSSTVTTSVTVGGDGKDREMTCLPLEFAFGWLFRIDSRNVKTESREGVLKYQMECYKALYDYFTGYATFVEYKQNLIVSQQSELKAVKKQFTDVRKLKSVAEEEMSRVIFMTYDDYKEEQRQLALFTDDEMNGGDYE